jgi:hypothetical protein
MLLISENDYTIMQLLMYFGFFWIAATIMLVRTFFIARVKEKLGRGKVTLKAGMDGIARFGNQKIEMGYFKDVDEHTQVALDKVVKTSDGDIYVMTEGFGLSYSLDEAAATNYLNKYGFMGLKDALIKWDEEYFDKDKHPENYAKLQEAKKADGFVGGDFAALETIRRRVVGEEKIKNVEIKRVLEESRNKLITLDIKWINEWTIPLAISYRWGLQNQGSMNNKNIYERGILMAKKESAQQGWTQEKIMGMATTGLMIIMGGAIAFAILYSTGAMNPKIPETITTTTLQATVTTVKTTASTIIMNLTNPT